MHFLWVFDIILRISERNDIMTTLLIIRHGESEANNQKVFAGQYDTPLQPRGVEQAKLTAEFIANNYKVDKVYASDLKRAFVTGKAIADRVGVEIIPDKNLREINCPLWDRVKFDEMHLVDEEKYKVWIEDIGNAQTPGGESTAEVGERVYNAVKRIAEENPDKTIAIASHGVAIRTLQSLVTTGGLTEMKNIPYVSNASVTELFYDDGEFKFGKISMDEHMGSLITTLPGII